MRLIKLMLILTISVFAVLLNGACSQTEVVKEVTKDSVTKETTDEETIVGTTAPEFELTTTKNEKVSLESLKGNPSVMVFWASYCGNCKKETPHINELAETYKPKGVNVIGVNYGETDEKLKEGVESFGIKYAVARDAEKNVAKTFKVKGTPTIVFLDKDGKVEFVGDKLPEDYAKRIDSLIG